MTPSQITLQSNSQVQSFTLILTGALDDTTNFGSVLGAFQKTPPREIRFDLSGVARTNSVGIREWLLFMDRVPPRCALVFEKVSYSFLEQANMVPNLLGASPVRITEFEVPEVCPKCEYLTKRFLRPEQIQRSADGKHWEYPTIQCEKCGTAMELDALDQEFFQFLSQLK